MHNFASITDIGRFVANIPAHIIEQTVGTTISAFSNGVQVGIEAVQAGAAEVAKNLGK